MIFTIKMHWKWFFYKNALANDFSIKCIGNDFTIEMLRKGFYDKNALVWFNLFNGISAFVGYLMPSHSSRRKVVNVLEIIFTKEMLRKGFYYKNASLDHEVVKVLRAIFDP